MKKPMIKAFKTKDLKYELAITMRSYCLPSFVNNKPALECPVSMGCFTELDRAAAQMLN